MNPISKLISFIELAYNDAPSDRFKLYREDTGYPMIIDEKNRIRVIIGTDGFLVTKYSMDDGRIFHELQVGWDQLTPEQKDKIIELTTPVEDLDPAMEELLNDIFKGVFD